MLFSRKQTDPYLLFKPGYLFGERRLSDLQPMRGTAEIQLLSRDHKISEMAKLNVSMPDTVGQTGPGSELRLSFGFHHCRCWLN
jgi:hypothetical protein